MEAVYENNANFPANAADGAMPRSASVALDKNWRGSSVGIGRRGTHFPELQFRDTNAAFSRFNDETTKCLLISIRIWL